MNEHIRHSINDLSTVPHDTSAGVTPEVTGDEAQKLSPMLRSLIILEQVAAANGSVSGADLVKALGVPKQTVHRIARQLEIEGFLQRESDAKRYLPGPRLRDIAVNVHLNSAAAGPRHAILQALADEVGETCNCTIIDRNELVYFDRVEANWPYPIHVPVGSRHPLHCTASGKLLLAFLTARQRRQLISVAPLKRFTDRTTVDTQSLSDELKRTRQTGVGEDHEEYLPGMSAIAVPVINNANKVGFALAIQAPTSRKPVAALKAYLPAMREAAAAIAAAGPEQFETASPN